MLQKVLKQYAMSLETQATSHWFILGNHKACYSNAAWLVMPYIIAHQNSQQQLA